MRRLLALLAGLLLAAPLLASTPPETTPDAPATNQDSNLGGPSGSAPRWIMVGPGAGGAFNNALETNDGTLLVGGDVGGLFRSRDRGLSWLPIGKLNSAGGTAGNSTIFDRTNVSAMAFDPRTDTSVVYIGIEGGLLRSVDGGRTFHARLCDSSSVTDWIASVKVCDYHPDTVLVAWCSGFADSTRNCIRYCAGANARGLDTVSVTDHAWRRVPMAATGALPTQGLRIIKVGCKGNNASFMYALSGSDGMIDYNSNPLYNSLYRSRDGGQTWTDITPGTRTNAGDGAWDFLVDPYHPDTVYCTTWKGSISAGTYTGNTWVKVHQDSAFRIISAHTGALAYSKRGSNGIALEPRIYTIDIKRDWSNAECGVWKASSPTQQNTAPVSNGPFTQISTGSETSFRTGWQFVEKWAFGASERGVPNTIASSALDTAAFYWTTSEYVTKGDTLGIFDPIYTTYKRSGPAAGNDFWQGRAIGNTIPLSASASGNLLAVGWWDLGVGLSTDAGRTWQMVNDSLMTDPGVGGRPTGACGNCATSWYGHGGDCSAILLDPAKSSTIWAGQGTGKTGQRIMRSIRSGVPASWDSTSGLPGEGLPASPGSLLYGLSLDAKSTVGTRKMWVTSNGDLFKSTDDGVTWTRIWDRPSVGSLTTGNIDSVLRVTAVRGNTVLAGGPGGLYRATDGGADSNSFAKIFGPGGNPAGAAGSGYRPCWAFSSTGNGYDFRYRGVHDIVAGDANEWFATIAGGASGSPNYTLVQSSTDSAGVWRSTDDGATWSLVHGGGYDDRFHRTKDGAWWVSSRSVGAGGGLTNGEGLWRSRDKGRSWQQVAANMPWPSTCAMTSDPINGEWIIVTALGPGVFRGNLAGVGFVPHGHH